jgi:ribonuclease HI
MKQRGIGEDSAHVDAHKSSVWQLFVDGASRNNPGPSGAGMYILKDSLVMIKEGYYLGIKTNNQAEYLALLLGLFMVLEHVKDGDQIHIISDSQLLVRQLMGVYKVRQPHLQPLHMACKKIMHQYGATIAHVLRDENSEADAMANQGVDYKKTPPKKYITLLNGYDIFL